MIPRTKVNYTLAEVLRAALVTERGSDYREPLRALLRNYLGQEHVLLTPSGRGALYFILRALPQPRVLMPAYTCKAVAEAAMLAGKEIVHVEIEPDGFNMDLAALAKAVDGRSIVIATHQFGIPCAIEAIVDLCHGKGAVVVEDAAPSLGSRVGGRLTGTFGDAAFYSFDSTKLINVPMKGGFLTAKDPGLFQRICDLYRKDIKPLPWLQTFKLLVAAIILLALGNHILYRCFHKLMFEWRGRFTGDSAVLNQTLDQFYVYDMANWQAYMAAGQVRKIDQIIAFRQLRYAEYLAKLDGCRAFIAPPVDRNAEWACIRFPIRVAGDKLAYYRRATRRGVDFAFSFTFLACPKEFTNAIRLADSVLDLPFYLKLTANETDDVVAALRKMEHDE